MTKSDFDSWCSILTPDSVPCKLISGSGGNYELLPDVFNGDPFFTLTLPDGYIVRRAILTRINQQDV